MGLAWLSVLLALFAAGCSGGGTPEAAPGTEATPNAQVTPSVEAGSVAAASPTATRPTPARPLERPEFVPTSGARDLRTVLGSAGAPLPVRHRTVQSLPASLVRPWNRLDVVLYDIEGGRETNLGPGGFVGFTRDGRYLYWITGDPVIGGESKLVVLEIQTGGIRTLGEARGVRPDRETGYLQVQVPGGRFERVALLDGSRATGAPDLGSQDRTPLVAEYAGWRLESLLTNGWAYGFGQYRLSDVTGTQAPFEFEVWQVALLPDGALIVATSPSDFREQAGAIRGRTAATDILEVDLASGDVTLIARARATDHLFPFAATQRYVVWTEDFCNMTSFPDSNGRTKVYDRQSGVVTELDQGLYVAGITPRGELAIGAFGADALLDLETLEYTVVFPSEDRVWSPDYRYAAVGGGGGHGGYCGGE